MKKTKEQKFELGCKQIRMKIDILENHGIPTKVVEGKVYALDRWTQHPRTGPKWIRILGNTWIDVTDWSNNKVYSWLGY